MNINIKLDFISYCIYFLILFKIYKNYFSLES